MSLKQNIIYLYFKGKHLITSKSQYQYNHGQYLYFADLNLPQAFEVHFSNKDRGESKTQIGSNKLVEIPDEYFWNGALQIYAWVYLHDGTDDGETIYEVRIPLIKRAKPTDEEPLPVQQSAIDKAIAELNNAVDITNENADKTNADKTQVATIKEEVVTLKEEIDSTASAVSQDAQSARESADASEQSAQNSAESERKALDYSDEAKGYAQSALESKDTASQKAQIATDASAEAKGYRDEAETFKNEAEQAKQNIVDYRDETKGYRDETLNLKNTVQTLKNQADETAEEIKGISDIVKEDAQSASQSASSANQSSINASQSASQAKKSANDAEESANQAEQNKDQTETFKNQSEEYKSQANTFKSQTETFKNQAEEFKNQTETNVTHYPKIIGEYWYVWDATNGEYINTNVDANGIKGDTGRGIASIALNDDYTLTITFTDDTTYTTSSIRGQQGEKGDTGRTGESGVYIGTEEPENEDIKVWIDTDDDGTSEDLVKEIESLKENIYKPYAVDSASGAIASFSDGADDIPLKSLVVDINPIQDLHGYDSPWVAGGGKNKINAPDVTISSGSYLYNGALALPAGTYTLSFISSSGASTSASISITDADGTAMVTGSHVIPYTFTLPNASVFVKIYVSGAGTYTNIQIEEGSSATSYVPYENICPISGWTGCGVNATGKNLFDKNSYLSYKGYFDDSEIVYNVGHLIVYIPCKPNTTYTVNRQRTVTNERFAVSWTKVVPSSHVAIYNKKTSTNTGTVGDWMSLTITTGEDAKYLAVWAWWNSSVDPSDTFQIELSDTMTDYAPYQGQSIPISWQTEAGTVYGGKFDVLSGVLRVDMAIADLGMLNWHNRNTATSGINRFLCSVESLDIKLPSANNVRANMICDRYATETADGTYLKRQGIAINASDKRIFVFDPQYNDVTDFMASFDHLYLCYELATPIEIQLSPNQINSLYGHNNLWADTGNSHVEYRADTKLYINKKIAEALASLT